MVPRRILVATDGSAPARQAEVFAAGMAEMMADRQVVVATVVREHLRPPRGGGADFASEDEIAAAEELVAAAAERMRQAMTGRTAAITTKVLQAGSPAAGIVQEAHADGCCSLIVLGNRGLGGLSSLVLGSVSDQVLHEAHCPVLVVKGDDCP